MIRKHDDLIGSLIHDVAHLLRLKIDSALKPHGLTRVKWLALGILKRQDGISQNALAQQLELGDAAVGRLVDRLQNRGLVTRISDPSDRRSWMLVPTAKALTLLDALEPLAEQLRDEVLSDVPEQTLVDLENGLARLKQRLKEAPAMPPAATTPTQNAETTPQARALNDAG